MPYDSTLRSRRAGLAGAAAFFLAAFSRTMAAGAKPDTGLPPPPCCGNGPPNVAKFGVGTQVTPLDGSVPGYQFRNPFWGRDGTKGQYVWVFVPDLGVMVTSYTDPNGVQQQVISYTNPKGYHGIVFLIAPGYTLELQWPSGDTPKFSTRPLGSTE